MSKISSAEDLAKMRERLLEDLEVRENSEEPERLPQIRVSMDYCGITAGAKNTLTTFVDELAARRIRAVVTQCECLGRCDQEPVVEITLPGQKPVLYGKVTPERVSELIEKQVIRRQPVDGIIT